MLPPIACRIVENALPARIAARLLRGQAAAMVVGSTLYLWGATAGDFLADTRWRRHEACHVLQYRRHGICGFLLRYAWETIRHGYEGNAFEVEARAASGRADIDASVGFHV